MGRTIAIVTTILLGLCIFGCKDDASHPRPRPARTKPLIERSSQPEPDDSGASASIPRLFEGDYTGAYRWDDPDMWMEPRTGP